MGGSAYLIHVVPDFEKVVRPLLDAEKNAQKSFFSRLLGFQKGGFADLADIHCEKLGKKMLDDFYGWAKARTPNPTPATAAFMNDYLFPIRGSVYLRGERPDPAKPEEFSAWYLQVSFSGCAGMGEVSAMAASHWVELWRRENQTRINGEILLPAGLRYNDNAEEFPVYGPFFEFAGRGMALYYPKGSETEFFLGEKEISVNFELDAGVEESIRGEEDLSRFRREITETQANLPPELERKVCLCQICREG